MTIDDKNISDDFTALAQTWKDRQTIFLIDGSGSMVGAYDGGENPIVLTVNYATELRKTHDNRAMAFFFGEPDERLNPIDLENGEDPMRRYPGGQGLLLPSLNVVAQAYESGRILPKMHLVIVSDGDISDFGDDGAQRVRQKLATFLSSNPDVMIDVIVPAKSSRSPFAEMMGNIMPENSPRAPRVHLAHTAQDLSGAIAGLIEGRLNLKAAAEKRQSLIDGLVADALDGVREPVRLMASLKIKKNVVE